METWFWILGWVLSFLAIAGNGITIYLVCSRGNLRTKTNAFIVSLAVADLCVGLSVIPSLLACDITNTCYWPKVFPSWIDVIRWLFSYLSVLNLCSLVLDRYIAIIKPFKYIPFMTRSRLIQVITSCWIASFTLVALKTALRLCCETPLTSIVAVAVLMICMEIIPCILQILCFVSMLLHVWKHDQSARTLAKQLRFNHRISFKTHHEKSAVIMMGIVIGVFVVCYGIYLHCSLVVLSDTNASCKDEQYKIPVLVLNSAINPLSYAFFKRDIKKEFKRLIGKVVFMKVRMETWFWILGWVLSFLAITGNGFVIFLVFSRRNLRTKTNAFIVSLAVADFCVGLSVVPSLFACDVTNTCYWPKVFPSWKDVVRWLFSYLSVLNLCALVFDRYIAIVKPFKYITFMTRSRVIQVITSCWIASFTLVAFKTALRLCCETPLTSIVAVVVLMIFMEIVPCVMQVLCFASILLHVWKHDRSARTLAKQLRFNHRISFKTHNEKSAAIMMGIVIGVFVVCYGIYLRCSLVVLSDTNASCKDEQYKIPVLVLNSAINPLSYAFFKRDIKKEFKRLISLVVFKKSNQVEPSTYTLDHF
ncbi:unnamed protein product [Porites lobata]|uniref:G-protein coupled receptors family 1 profile domain-containing protein n=1 Tax=Porites lobata TaxID=104759 RepID=A0ABN8RR59_9CNID|nr:unnamed protein product [Porites lobata]